MKRYKKPLVFIAILVIGVITFLSTVNINEFGLKVLTKIKEMKGEAVDYNALESTRALEISHELWDKIVKEHVSEKGNVNYTAIQNNSNDLNSYLNLLSNNPPNRKWTYEAQLAYWINAYNAYTVKLILDHMPLRSIKDISSGLPMINSPWDIKFFKIGGIDFDLNTIEHQILRQKFDEPRIHFAINCASFSCPKLRNEAFTAEKIENQLIDQTTDFFADIRKNDISSTTNRLSSIMNWFESDFTKDQTLEEFISKYHKDFNIKNKVQFIEYDWSLNN